MGRVVVVGSLNCDLVMRTPRLPRPGETVPATSFDVFVGGKGCNQAIASARMGADVAMIGCLGSDAFADRILDALRAAGVDTEFVRRVDGVSTGVASIWVDSDGTKSIAVAPQANARLDAADVERALGALAARREGGIDVVLLQLETPLAASIAAARWARAHGARVVLNPAPAERGLPAEFLRNVDILVPNESEAALLLEDGAAPFQDAPAAARRLLSLGVGSALVTLGERGSVLATISSAGTHELFAAPAFPVDVVDTTAAGDAFCGGLSAALAAGETLASAIRWASGAGALACTRSGAEPSLPARAEVESLFHGGQQ